MKVKIGVSNRHVHLTKEIYTKLFGKEQLEKDKELVQPGQFASTSYVTIRNGGKYIENVRILGPFRKYNQVEISKTDAYKLKVKPPIRKSGDLKGSGNITIIGPKGSVALPEGLIIPEKHIHITPSDVKKYGFENLKKIAILIDNEGLIDNIKFKVEETAVLELHLNTDEANAFGLKQGDDVTIVQSIFKND